MSDFRSHSPPPLIEEPTSAPFLPQQPPLPAPTISVPRQRFRVDRPESTSTAAVPPRQGVLRRGGGRTSLDASRLRFEQNVNGNGNHNGTGNGNNNNNAPILPAPSLLQRQAVLNPSASLDGLSRANNNNNNSNYSARDDETHGNNSNNNTGHNDASENSPLLDHNSSSAYYSGREDSGDGDGDVYDDGVYDDDDPIYIKSVYLLSLSIVFIVSVVFVIIVSGLTTLVSKRNTPRFRISSDWKNTHHIPKKYGCNSPVPISIPLYWKNVPASATNLVVLFSNADSDKVHWLVTDIPLTGETAVKELPANASANPKYMPQQAHQQPNSHLENGLYFPPCHSNIFVIHAYAIDQQAKVIQSNSSRKIMNSFVGVPTARYSGSYGVSHRYSVVDDAHDEESPYVL